MYFILLTIITSFLFFSCASSTIDDSGNSTIIEEPILDSQECEDPDISCDALSYFVYEAYSNSDFEGAVENANEAIACGCGATNATDIYNFLARSYVELDEDSKATESIEKGLIYDSDNIKMIELAIWNARRLNDSDEEIMYLENLLSLKKDTKVFENLADIYRREKKYNDQIRVIKEWLKHDPDNSKASQELKLAFKITGRDELELDKESCEKNPNNFDLCFNYASNLASATRFDESLEVLSKLKNENPRNEKLLEKMGEVYLKNYDDDNALSIYKELIDINDNKSSYFIEISKIYQDKEKYASAYKWGKKALRISPDDGYVIFNLAEILKGAVESCSSDSYSLEDKVVYQIAYRFYKDAYKRGYKESKFMINFFKEQKKDVLPQLEDWFLIDSSLDEFRPIDINPNNSCYTWIDKKVSKVTK